MNPKKQLKSKSRSLVKEVEEGWNYFWRKRGMMPPKSSIMPMSMSCEDEKPIKPKTEH